MLESEKSKNILVIQRCLSLFQIRPDELYPIPGYSDYFADAYGNIWSKKRTLRKLTPDIRPDGYVRVSVMADVDGKTHSRYVHRLVCSAFHGLPPKGMQASHLDGDRQNNCINNLNWETAKQNTNRKREHGTMGLNGKLDKNEVLEIVEMLKSGIPQNDIAEKFNITQANVSRIKTSYTDLKSGSLRDLTVEDYSDIRRMIEVENISQAEVGRRYHLTPSAIWRIKKRGYESLR